MSLIEPFIASLAARGITPDRRRAQRKLLRAFELWIAPESLANSKGAALEAFLAAKLAGGCHPNTARKWRHMALSFFQWAYESGYVTPEVLLSVRAVKPPPGSSGRASPKPYKRTELSRFWESLDSRWPKLSEEEAQKWLARWRDGKSPYSRIRRHAIRLQLEAVVALALYCGLRRREIGAVTIDDLWQENACIPVFEGERWENGVRAVPYPEIARQTVGAWLDFRDGLGPEHTVPWLNLWAERTARDPMKRSTFQKLMSTYLGAGWTLSRFRHTCGVTWLTTGLDVWQLQRLLGHASLKDTLPYTETVNGNLESDVERLEAVFSERLSLPVAA